MTKHGKGSSFQTTHVFIAKRGSRGSVPGMAMKQGEENEKEHSRQQTRTSTYEDLLSGDRTGEPERPLRSPAVVRSGSELGGAEPSRQTTGAGDKQASPPSNAAKAIWWHVGDKGPPFLVCRSHPLAGPRPGAGSAKLGDWREPSGRLESGPALQRMAAVHRPPEAPGSGGSTAAKVQNAS